MGNESDMSSRKRDVGPETRQSTLENRGPNGRLYLTLPDVVFRRQMAERAVWAALIVIDAPRFDLGPRILDGPRTRISVRLRV
jgi:hypothetical protein